MSACIIIVTTDFPCTFTIKETKFNYGKGKNNPMELHYFYGKKFQKHPFHLPKEEVKEIKNKKLQIKKFKGVRVSSTTF